MSRYRKHAAHCRELEQAAGSAEERRLLSDLARHWDAIADIHERLGADRPKAATP